jgi:hypothetical protein
MSKTLIKKIKRGKYKRSPETIEKNRQGMLKFWKNYRNAKEKVKKLHEALKGK